MGTCTTVHAFSLDAEGANGTGEEEPTTGGGD